MYIVFKTFGCQRVQFCQLLQVYLHVGCCVVNRWTRGLHSSSLQGCTGSGSRLGLLTASAGLSCLYPQKSYESSHFHKSYRIMRANTACTRSSYLWVFYYYKTPLAFTVYHWHTEFYNRKFNDLLVLLD